MLSSNCAASSVSVLTDYLIDQVDKLGAGQRFLLGIVGYPGSGKSTVSHLLVESVNNKKQNKIAEAVPMDGFHLSNEELEDKNLLPLKGIPESFNANGFLSLLRSLRQHTNAQVFCPLFDRSREISVENALIIEPEHKLCVVEGNYLLLEKKPWNECRQYFDQVWFIDSSFDEILPRLLQRHIEGGRTPEGARAKVESTDLPNARLVEAGKVLADRIIRLNIAGQLN